MTHQYTLKLESPAADLDQVGGKGANLARLARAGLAVPPGFLITTSAYRAFVAANGLAQTIDTTLVDTQLDDPVALRQASETIRAVFEKGQIPDAVEADITAAYYPFRTCPVAVRSSATAEDLPDFSFAGQQDTYLNIIGEKALLAAVIACWGSLWTARAIGYRARNQIPSDQVALAIVVQELVPSEASGVLFTANPLTGHRGQTVIDATLGLGEALVGGHVEPDHFVVEKASGRILSRQLGQKAIALQPDPAGGLVRVENDDVAGIASINDEQVAALNALGREVEAIYQEPQDIEWATAGNKIYLLQSRPVTSLFPIPPGEQHFVPVYFSFGSVQGLLGPITPLGQDAVRTLFAGLGSIFGISRTYKTQNGARQAGERLWMNFSHFLRHPLGYRLVSRMMGAIDPGAQGAVLALRDDPAVEFGRGRIRWRTFFKIARFGRMMSHPVRQAWRRPEERAAEIERQSAAEIARIAAEGDQIITTAGGPSGFAAYFQHLFNGFPYAVPEIAAGAVPGLVSFFALGQLAKRWGLSPDVALEISRGLPNNVTTEMDLALWATAQAIRDDDDSRRLFSDRAALGLTELFKAQKLPPAAQAALGDFLTRYGMRGLGEIDLGRPRWREDPSATIKTVQSYLKIDDPNLAPDAVFKRGEQAAAAAVDQIAAAARRRFLGRLKEKLVRALARRARGLAGLRESPKFHIIRLMGVIRQKLLAVGEQLVQAGALERADDLFFLNLDDLTALDQGEVRPWGSIVARRRAAFAQEQGRKQIPRILLGDGRAFYEGVLAVDDGSGDLVGSPVSPGVVEGVAHVIFDPHEADLQPGEILVCKGTDPAWTPLFLAAGGLIMEVGGLMTHGAIVAREYGIPAVVGVDQVTSRLQNGQRVRVDGSSGRVSILN